MFSKWFIYLSRFALVSALILIFCLSVIKIDQSLPGDLSDKFYHAFAFFVLGLLSHFSFPGSVFSYYKYVPLFFYGVFIESVQYFLPYRSFSIGDMVADAVGLWVCYCMIKLLVILGFWQTEATSAKPLVFFTRLFKK